MARGKLILICQSGGEFLTDDDGTLSYMGGEAHAVVIQPEALFDDLKLKLAEMWNLECKTMSIKYFLPGNKRTLITLATDKDLKRMVDFHGNAVTADVFVMGKQGFDQNAWGLHGSRENGIKLADSVNPVSLFMPVAAATASQAPGENSSADVGSLPVSTPGLVASTLMDTGVAHITSASTILLDTPINGPSTASVTSLHDDFVAQDVIAADAVPQSSTGFADFSGGRSPAAHSAYAVPNSTKLEPQHVLVDASEIDMECTPADTVKKRRRTASWKIGANGPTIVAVPDDAEERRQTSQRKNARRFTPATVAGNVDSQQRTVQLKGDFDVPISFENCDDVPLEKMVASWKDGIVGVGQEFKSVIEFRDALQKYAIAQRFTYRLKKNDTNRASGRCIVAGCSWKIHASWVPAAQSFRIKKMNKLHTCEDESRKSPHPAKNWLVNIIKDRLQDNPHQKPKEIAIGICRDFGIELTYTQVWRAIEDAREHLQGSYKEAYNQLPWLCEKILEINPGSAAKLSMSEDNRFQRLFLAFHPSLHGFEEGCRPILFLDSTSLKSKYHEILLIATAMDANDGFFPAAIAIVDDENMDNWRWFLEQLKSVLSNSRSITFVSDSEKALKEHVLEIFENAHYGYSMYHLMANFKKILRGPFRGDGKGSMLGNFYAAAHAVRLDGYKKYTQQIKQVSSTAYDWVMQIEPEHWTHALFKGQRYNQVMVNTVESYTKLLDQIRELPILQKMDALIRMVIELIDSCRMDSSKWSTKLTPLKEGELQQEILKAYSLKVLISSDTLFEVHDDCIHVVNVEKQKCTCLAWKPDGLPCRHAIAVFRSTGRSVYDYCPRFFTVESFRQTYSKSINPLPCLPTTGLNAETLSDTVVVLPPCTSRPQSQQKKQEIGSPGVARKVVTCTRCKGTGHNKATCKANL